MIRDLAEFVAQFQRRCLQDALNEATASYWLRRADQFEQARPSLSDFAGQMTLDQRRTKWHELTEIATACRNRAAVSLIQDDRIEPGVIEALRDVA